MVTTITATYSVEWYNAYTMGELIHLTGFGTEPEVQRPTFKLLSGNLTGASLEDVRTKAQANSSHFWYGELKHDALGPLSGAALVDFKIRRFKDTVLGHTDLDEDQKTLVAEPIEALRKKATSVGELKVKHENKYIGGTNLSIWENMPGGKHFVRHYLQELGDPLIVAAWTFEKYMPKELPEAQKTTGRAAIDLVLFGGGGDRFKKALGHAAFLHTQEGNYQRDQKRQ